MFGKTARTSDVLTRIGIYMAQQVDPLTDAEKADVWGTIIMWCEGDIQGIGYVMNGKGDWVPEDDDAGATDGEA